MKLNIFLLTDRNVAFELTLRKENVFRSNCLRNGDKYARVYAF